MILHLKGKVESVGRDGSVFISPFNGFSFQIDLLYPVSVHDDLDVWAYMLMKEVEGKMDLKFYGFSSFELIHDFENIISVSGVGPKMAFNILKVLPIQELGSIIKTGDYQSLKAVPGVGDKLAKRLVLELSRVYTDESDVLNKIKSKELSKNQLDVMNSLVKMGFDKDAVKDKIYNIEGDLPKGEILKMLLSELSKNE